MTLYGKYSKDHAAGLKNAVNFVVGLIYEINL